MEINKVKFSAPKGPFKGFKTNITLVLSSYKK